MKITRKSIALLLALLLLTGIAPAILAGCASSADKITIEVLTWHGPDSATGYYDGYKEAADEYMKKHKNVTITIKFEADGTYGSILETGFAGGTAPDIIQMKSAQRSTFSSYLLDLRSYLNEQNPYDTRNAKWIDNFIGGEGAFPAEVSADAANALLFIPHDGNPEIFTGHSYVFNIDLIEKAGLDPENTPDNWKDMFIWLEAIKANTDVAPIAGSSDVGGKVSQIGYEFGENYADLFFDNEITDPDFAGDLWWDKLYVLTCYEGGEGMPLDNLPYYPAMMKLMQKHIGFYQESWYENSYETEILTFASGNAAMLVSAFWDFDSLSSTLPQENFPKGYGMFPVPYLGTETLDYAVEKGWINQEEAAAAAPYAVDRHSAGGGSGMHEYGFTVNKKTADNEEKLNVTIDFLRFLTAKDQQEKYVETAKSLSPVKDVKIIDMMQQFLIDEPEGGYANYILGYTVIEWGKSGWDVEMIKFLKGEQDWQTTVINSSAAEWAGDIPSLEDLEGAVEAAKAELADASDDDKPAKERALRYNELRLKIYQEYYYEMTGDLTEQ